MLCKTKGILQSVLFLRFSITQQSILFFYSFVELIATLLNNGTSPNTGAQILKASTVDEMFTNQIPDFPQFARQYKPSTKSDSANATSISNMYPEPNDPPQGWGLTFMLTSMERSDPTSVGRGRNTAHWAGIANLFWWADREKDIGGMITSQVLPFGDPIVLAAWLQCEKAIYDSLSDRE
jgi:CubicO group peptidase (beta-lactamase class C family)